MRTRQDVLNYLKDYRTKNAERISRQKAEWYELHKEEERIKRQQYYQNNKDVFISRASKWRLENKEKMRKSREKWRLKNKERMNMHGANYRAKKKHSPFEKYDRIDIYNEYGGICGICNQKIDLELKFPNHYSFTIDHIKPIAIGGHDMKDNLQPAHYVCNSSKGMKCLN